MLFLVDHAGVQLNFFHLLLEDEYVALITLGRLALCCRLLSGRGLGRRPFEFSRAQLTSGSRLLLLRLRLLLLCSLLCRLLSGLLSVGRGLGSLCRLRRRTFHLRRT